MKTVTKKKILFIFLNEEDMKAILAGKEAATRYDGEHKTLMSIFPQHLIDEDNWMLKVSNPEVKFLGNSDYAINVSLFDARHSLIKALHVAEKDMPKEGIFRGISIFMPYSSDYCPETIIPQYLLGLRNH